MYTQVHVASKANKLSVGAVATCVLHLSCPINKESLTTIVTTYK